jgi:hypothetical protein
MMRKPLSVTRVFALLIVVLIGCKATDKPKEAPQPALQANGANVEAKQAGTQYQFRAVCIEKEAHGGNEYVLSKWFDSREKANEFGQYHGDFKYKGHRWRIEERIKPAQANP